jgi:hypothetical protein
MAWNGISLFFKAMSSIQSKEDFLIIPKGIIKYLTI